MSLPFGKHHIIVCRFSLRSETAENKQCSKIDIFSACLFYREILLPRRFRSYCPYLFEEFLIINCSDLLEHLSNTWDIQ
ncbi:hypothetical protein TPE_1268 [Treponema pedis str. T A4]|uniref:Uncharacterized protein n=1 Tax=Treponema pedis str. T A4 TaxID=1291379 RepID=S5ZZM7_9SPIR|nr:hypothetical protein TPE_1268 [Treponema pedis str. T A4]